ncbi:MAG: TonB family protein, partial [Cyclobacteriaceae bacterium]|nr:TonB family protein [Cyclobacteriaceae bacterium]
NTHHYRSKAMKYILAHEQAHSDQYHSVDVLLVELLKSIQWFNPIAWLFAKESIQNLEYLADKEVMDSQDNAQEYQMAIIQYSHHSGSKLLRSEFSKSNLKNRIIMMNQPNNQKIHMGKFLLFLPIIGALFISFSMKIENLDLRKEVSEILPIFNIQESNINKPLNIFSTDKLPVVHRKNNEPVSKLDTVKTLEDKIFTIADEQPYPSTGDMGSYFEKIHAELNYPLEAKEQGIKGKVFVQFIVQKDGTLREVMAVKGIGYGCDEEAVRIIKNGSLWVPGKDKGKNVDVRMILPITFSNDDHADTRNLSGTVLSESGDPVIGCNVIIKGTQIGTVSDREGRFSIKIKPEHAELVFAYIGMESQTINIAEEKDYKIIMKIDEGYVAPTKSEGNGISISVRGLEFMSENDRPMFILNGVEIQHEDFILIQPVDIESITVLKDHNAIDKFG